jgi:hypothetical protein
MTIKILLCNCKGLCQSFKNADMNTLESSACGLKNVACKRRRLYS